LRPDRWAIRSVDCAGLSDRGRVRRDNQDRWFADGKEQIFLVSDGMGGHPCGALAADRVTEMLPRQLQAVVADAVDLAAPLAVARVVATVRRLSRTIRQQGARRPDTAGMGATLVLAMIRADQVLVVHLGDSRAYLLRRHRLTRLTKDHTAAELLLESGVISAQQAARHPAGGQLTRYVGMSGKALPETRLASLHPGDRILLCSDGLTRMLSDEQLRVILAREPNPERACRRLIDRANESGGRDNITALIVAM
jgi:protein phosphatase